MEPSCTEVDTSKVYDIQCRTWETNDPEQEEVHTAFGIIAEELKELFPDVVCHDADGEPFSLDYPRLVVPVIAELQKLKEKVTALENAS